MDVRKKNFVVFDRGTGRLIKISFDRYLDIVSEKDKKDGIMVVRPEKFYNYLRKVRAEKRKIFEITED